MKAFIFISLISFSISVGAQRTLKKVVVIEEYQKAKLRAPKKRVLLEIRFNEKGEKEHIQRIPCSVQDLDLFDANVPNSLSTSVQAVLRSVRDTTKYTLEYDPVGRLISAQSKETKAIQESDDPFQEYSEDPLPSWNFQYDTLGNIHSAHRNFRIFRGGGSEHCYNENGQEVKRVHWHPRGFINSTEELTYHNGLPVLRKTLWRGGIEVRKLYYTYTFY